MMKSLHREGMVEEMAPEPDENEINKRLRALLGDDEATDELSQLDLNVSQAADEARSGVDMGDDFDSRLKKLEERANKVQVARDAKKQEEAKAQKSDQESHRGVGVGLQIAYIVIGSPLAGYFIGWLIDSRLHSESAKGIGMLLGSVLGITMAFVLMNRENNR